MKRKLFNSSRRYQDALRNQMKQGQKATRYAISAGIIERSVQLTIV